MNIVRFADFPKKSNEIFMEKKKMTTEITIRVYKVLVWEEDAAGRESQNSIALLFMDARYDVDLVASYLDGNETALFVGEIKQVGERSVLNTIPPIYRLELND
jgi:hypothetical protein